MYNDPEIQTTRLSRAILNAKRRVRQLQAQPLFQYYFWLALGLLTVYILRWITPQHVLDEIHDFDLAAPPVHYSKLLPIIEYETLIQNDVLRKRFAYQTSLRSVVVPRSVEEISLTLDSIRIAKELGVIHSALNGVATKYGFDCVPAVALGIDYNIILMPDRSLCLNVRYARNVPIAATDREEISIQDVFGDTQTFLYSPGVSINLTYIDKSFQLVEQKEISDDIDKICIQYYLSAFHFN